MTSLARVQRGAGGDATAPPLVLASASAARRRLLENAGVPLWACEAARIDEAAVKVALRGEGASAAEAAEALAELKALRIASRYPHALVIGADQIVVCDDTWFDKPPDLAHAAAQLAALAGRSHVLATAVCVVRDGRRIWHHLAQPRLTLRPLTPQFVEAYLEAVGDAALRSGGAYQLEGRGVQLFSRIEGDYFSILGLPLLPLLDFLRQHAVVPS